MSAVPTLAQALTQLLAGAWLAQAIAVIAKLGVAVDCALVRVVALAQEGNPQGRRLTVRELPCVAALDAEVVFDRADVRDLEDHEASLRGLLAEDELEVLGCDFDLRYQRGSVSCMCRRRCSGGNPKGYD
jgi:hypothetical protein